MFDIEEKPESMTIMGAGYIGLEIAMAYNRLGVKVRLIEFTDRVIRKETPDISQEIQKYMKVEGIEFLPNYRAYKFEKSGNDTIIHCKTPDGSISKLGRPVSIIIPALLISPQFTGMPRNLSLVPHRPGPSRI